MKKKVVVTYEDGGKLIYRGYAEKDDNYFLDIYKGDVGIKKIVRQYYPLKDNKKVVLWEK